MRTLRSRLGVMAMILVLLVGSGAIVASSIQSPGTVKLFTESVERRAYQTELNRSTRRLDPHMEIVVVNGLVWLRTENIIGYCEYRCGTLVTTGRGHKVSLPVGYVHGTNVSPMPVDLQPVDSLTFWNPITHKSETIQMAAGQESVVMPDFLQKLRERSALKIGETGFVPSDFVRRGLDGTVYLLDGFVAYEPLGSAYLTDLEAQITRTGEDTYEIRLPQGDGPGPNLRTPADERWKQVVLVR